MNKDIRTHLAALNAAWQRTNAADLTETRSACFFLQKRVRLTPWCAETVVSLRCFGEVVLAIAPLSIPRLLRATKRGNLGEN
jgi:hypothetical protein